MCYNMGMEKVATSFCSFEPLSLLNDISFEDEDEYVAMSGSVHERLG